jgi:secondary thiamine-phosphate synthase enzyme
MPEVKVFNFTYSFSTRAEGEFFDLTGTVQEVVEKSGIKNGIIHAFAPHATGVLVLTENDPALLNDIRLFVEKIVPRNAHYNHPSNAHSHLRSILFAPDRTLSVVDGQAGFGTWQSLLFLETDVYPRRRSIIFQVIGET